ncbi:putative lipid II flippase FtsW [Candidatus Viridilinea mediisalina]|uniref:Probable peptidoglycan glycosyltransferase FtsW n=1 Tax=Candidatus Viridilinea mediisalina TaxID=2024553 RepID=A0A2A6RPN5_9CHLR|nr:putative lipid II flippase FtsW [Candidatus Viridilinea mediisalina]PDW04893.1 putative lipid II flippase FtsW [Candidatus Viridilinea mediisalina]
MAERTHKPDYLLLATVGSLVAFGLVMIYSSSFVEGYNLHNNQYYYLLRQMVGAAIGTVGLLVAQRIDYRMWRKYSIHLMAACIGLLVLVLILPASITEVNNSRSWIRLGEGGVFGLFSVQPAEIAKLIIIIYFADWLSRRSEKVGNVTYGLIPFAVMMGLIFGLVMLQPDLGTGVVLVLIGGSIYFAAGARVWHILGAIGLAVASFWFLISVAGYRNARIMAFQDPEKYYSTFGFQPTHALYALGSGGIFGQGLGQARQKFQWLPQAHTDTIYAIIGEELGLVGTVLVLIAFAIIAYRGYRIAGRAPNPFASLVAVGITSWITLQAFINLGVTTSLLPFTGLTLPFVSYGSTSLYMNMIAIGVLLNISKHTSQHQPEEITDAPRIRPRPKLAFLNNLAVWRGHGRARLPGFGSGHRYRRR